MPFCTQCGSQMGSDGAFCAACGSRQREAPQSSSSSSAAASGAGRPAAAGIQLKGVLDNMSPRTASILCYIPVLGWVPSIVMLASARFQHDREVRFHAFQGLYLFVAWLLVDWVVGPMFRGMGLHIGSMMKVVIVAAWIFMLVKTRQREHYRLPIFGELAERSVLEQR